METWEGKSFSITDPKGVNTVIYQIIKTPKALLKEYPKYALERLESTDEIRGDMIRKTFYVDFPSVDLKTAFDVLDAFHFLDDFDGTLDLTG